MPRVLLNAFVCTTLALSACAKDDLPTEVASALPPQDSVELPAFFDGNSGAVTATPNLAAAKTSVGLVTLAINLALIIPKATFWATVTSGASKDGDGWRWVRTFPLLGWESDLYGTFANGTIDLSMKMTGLNANNNTVVDFEWFTGSHQAGSGNWTFFDHNKPTEGDVLTIDWQRASDTDKTLTFTNVDSTSNGFNDSIVYNLDGTTASMTINDTDVGTFSVEWDTVEGSGKLTRVTSEELCWDTLANGQVDIACP